MSMYTKNLTEDLRLRLSEDDMNFLRELSDKRACSISECIRSILGEYRRSVDMLATLNGILDMSRKEGGLSNGDIKTDINSKL